RLLLGPVRKAAGPEVVVLVEVALLARSEVLTAALEPVLGHRERLVTVDVDALVLGLDLVLEPDEILAALLGVDVRDDRGGEVEHLLELARCDVEQVADAARDALGEPDVRDGRGGVNVPHSPTANLLPPGLHPEAAR